MAGRDMSTPEAVSNGVTFEVERFEWVDGDRLEVTGRWYGLRGHRFVRPVLVVQAAHDEQRRLLAILDHKPWAAEDGDEWIAAFPWEGEPLELTAAELAVAPSLAVDLPMPRVPGQGGAAPPGSEGPLHARRGPAEPKPEPAEPTPEPAEPAPARRGRAKAAKPAPPPASPAPAESVTPEEVAALRAQLASEQASVRRLATQLEEAHQGLAAARATADDHDALVSERDAAIAARDEARANANLDHDAVIEERDQAVQRARRRALRARRGARRARRGQLRAQERHRRARRRVRRARPRDRGPPGRGARPRGARAARGGRRAGAPGGDRQRAARGCRPGHARRGPRHAVSGPGIVWVQRVVALIVLIVWAIVVYKVLHGLV